MRLLAHLMLLLVLTGCGAETPPAEPPPAAPPAAPNSAAGSVPADHVLQPQLQALDKARGVQELTDTSKARVDEAVDEQQP